MLNQGKFVGKTIVVSMTFGLISSLLPDLSAAQVNILHSHVPCLYSSQYIL